MLLAGDLGFSSLVLVICVLFPVVSFVIRRKWRLAVARKEEIRRLLVLASEEAARAEFEANISYAAVSVPVSRNNYQCAVCYRPTTTRCARCKSVRYCSGKCQIIHWRQGHKEECQPPWPTYHINDNGSNSGQKVAKQGIIDNGRYEDAQIETSPSAVSHSSYSTGDPCIKENKVISDPRKDAEETYSTESSGFPFSGFSTSAVSGESSDDVSVNESILSNEFEGPDGQISSGTGPGIQASSLDNVDRTKPSSPKFARLVDSIDSFSTFSKLSQISFHDSRGEIQCATSSSSCQSPDATFRGSTTSPSSKASSDFWGRALDSTLSKSHPQGYSTLSNFNGAVNGKLSEFESSLQFKFNFSREDVPSLDAQKSVVKTIMSDDFHSAARPADRAALSENVSGDKQKFATSLPVSYARSNSIDKNYSDDSKVSSSSSQTHQPSCSQADLSGRDVLKVFRSPSLCSARPSNEPIGAPHLSKSKLSSTCQTHYATGATGHSVPNGKLSKPSNVETSVATSSQVPSFSPGSVNGLKSSVQKVVDQFIGAKSGKYGEKGLFPYDLFVRLYTSNKVEMRPFGLINCGNSCYANAVLQCLACTPPLSAYLVQGLHSKTCVRKEWCFSCEFEDLILKAKEGKSPVSPINILSQLQNMGTKLGSGREEDAHEFLRYAIDQMQSICLKEAGVSVIGSLEEETTLIGHTFGGYLRSKIKCMKCHYKSERQERMMDLAVEIEGEIGKLEDALRRFTRTEILDGDNKYHCSRCKSYEKAKKKLTILEAPNILTIALKRFQSGKFGKLNKPVRFPEILDLAPYISGTSDKSPIYRLYGVVVHLDVMNAAFSGHYVCYVKAMQNKWFKIDDSMVTPVELDSVLTKGAYMLLYARCSPRAPRLLRNIMVSPDPKNKGIPPRINGKNTKSNSRSTSTRLSAVQSHPNSVDDMANVESFFSKFHRLQRILEEDSSSDNYSFTSSNSDEGSCSTDSTRESTSTDELSEYIFGGSNSSWRNTPDTDSCSSSSSPLYSRHLPFADRDQNASSISKTSRSQIDHSSSPMEHNERWDVNSDTAKKCRNLVDSSSCRETDSGKLGMVDPFNDVNSGVSFRRSNRERRG
uniref:ubiquitinyl hydrolase 1 n=1 Tax=Rhizophora mucronata TaxID=61149 RepID=A0A2P2L7B7_RHIMU